MKINITERILHFKQPAGTSRGVYTERKIWLVEMKEGERKGIGECAPLQQLSCDDIPHYAETLRMFCDQIEQTGVIDYQALRPYPSMLFGLESAWAQLHVNGSAKLFDTPFGRGEEGITINGLVWMGTFEEMYQRIEEKIQAGFHCVKLKIGAIDWEREISLIKFIRQHFTKEQIELRVDANGGFTPQEAMRKLEQLATYDIHSIEQPIKQLQWKEMARLCHETPLPIALDEELIGINDTKNKIELLDTIRPQYIILKPSLHGGMHGSEEWIKLAQERSIGSWITSALESNIGLNAIAHFAAKMYGPHISMPQGLGTGQLFTDNIPMPIEIRGEKLYFNA